MVNVQAVYKVASTLSIIAQSDDKSEEQGMRKARD